MHPFIFFLKVFLPTCHLLVFVPFIISLISVPFFFCLIHPQCLYLFYPWPFFYLCHFALHYAPLHFSSEGILACMPLTCLRFFHNISYFCPFFFCLIHPQCLYLFYPWPFFYLCHFALHYAPLHFSSEGILACMPLTCLCFFHNISYFCPFFFCLIHPQCLYLFYPWPFFYLCHFALHYAPLHFSSEGILACMPLTCLCFFHNISYFCPFFFCLIHPQCLYLFYPWPFFYLCHFALHYAPLHFSSEGYSCLHALNLSLFLS